jgi:uncharacterized membrane protein
MVESFSDRLQNREPADLLNDVRSYARRKPGTFLIGAAVLGVVAGRLTSGIKAAHSDSGPSSAQHRSAAGYSANYVDPAPAYGGYETGYQTGYAETVTTGTTGITGGAPLPPPPYGTVPPAGSVVPPTTPAGWDDPNRTPGV